MTEFRELSITDMEPVKTLFYEVFTKAPWNDDWSDANQLHLYMIDLMGNPNSLTYGLYQDEMLIGLSIGHTSHWYSGTQYCIDELCISTERQGQGLGSFFLESIQKSILEKGCTNIFLQTEKGVSAYQFYKKIGFIDLDNHVSLCKSLK